MPPNQFLPPKVRRPRAELDALVGHIDTMGYTVAGSYRREKSTVGDLDIIIPSHIDFGEAEMMLHAFIGYEAIRSGAMKSEGLAEYNGQLLLNLWRVPSSQAWAGMLLFATGPMDLNIMMRAKAQSKTYKLNQYGLFLNSDERLGGDSDQLDKGEEEKQIFELLDIQYLNPMERELWRTHLLPRPKSSGTFVSVLSSDGVSTYSVSIENGRAVECECKGYAYRHHCRHLAEAEKKL